MTRSIAITFLLLIGICGIYGQETVLVRGNPPLTQAVVDRLESVYARLLNIKFDRGERGRFRDGLIKYWTENNRDGIRMSLENLKYFDSPDQIEDLRDSSQTVIVESLRRDAAETGDQVSGVIVEAFDIAHPNLREATRAHTVAVLVGTWKRQDALGSQIDPNNGIAVGVSYTDSGTLEINSTGTFTFVKVHNHCSGGCCRMDGSEESGSVSIVSGKLVFQTNKGSKLIEDACMGAKQRTAIKAHGESFTWSIRPNPNNDAITLCINTELGKAECYEKQ